MKLYRTSLVFASILFFIAALTARATITELSYWRMGENDGNPFFNGVPSTTVDIVGGRTMSLPGGPFWRNTTYTSGTRISSWCMYFFASGVNGNATVLTPTDNFGLEFWVNPDNTTSNCCLAYNGTSTANGWGIYKNNGTYQARIGTTAFGSGTATAGTWTHLALVRNNGTATFYVNGTAAGTSTTAPVTPTVKFYVATMNGVDNFVGFIDELRVFTFTANQFSTSDLLVNAVLPVVTTGVTNNLTATNVTLNGTINPGGLTTSYYFQYGTTTNYGSNSVTGTLAASQSASGVTATVSNLTATTTYHYRVVATSSAGTVTGLDKTFITGTAVPAVSAQSATSVTTNSATLNGLVQPNGATTSVSFQYGLTTAYGNNSATQTVANTGLTFNGASQTAGIAAISGLTNGNSHTIEAWINPTLLPASREWVVLLGNATTGAHHWLLNADGSTQIGSYGAGQSTPHITGNVWTHVASSYDGTTLRVYTNGVLVSSTNTTFNLAGIPLTVAQVYGGESYYGGGMDDLRIWNVGRSASQIQTNYNTTLTGTETGLIGYYQMDETTGNVLMDVSGHSNNLLKANSPVSSSPAPLVLPFTRSSQTITGLAPGSTYHFRIIGANGLGTASGPDQTFTTPAVAPAITAQSASGVTNTSATLNASVNPNGAATVVYFKYGTSTSYGNFSATNSLAATNIVVTTNSIITGLTANTLYHYQVVASNSIGTTSSADQTFSTTVYLPPSITAPSTTQIASVSALLNASVNPNNLATIVYFKYGVTAAYGSFSGTNSLPALNMVFALSSGISSLNPGTLYHYQVVAINSSGTTTSSDQTFTTTADAPAITAPSATSITSTGATLNSSINPNGAATTVYFKYGTTASYGSFSATNSLAATNVVVTTNSVIGGLNPGTLYHYQVVAANSVGTTTSSDQTFTTTAAAPVITSPSATGITTNTATLNASINPNGAVTAVYFQYGLTAAYGSFSTTNSLAATNVFIATNSVISGLAGGTVYHYQVVAVNSVNTTSSSDLTFSTAAIAPTATTQPATTLTGTGATLNGTVNPGGGIASVFFQYGLTTNYGSFSTTNSLAATNGLLAVSNTVTGLTALTNYHFQLVASNSAGVAYGGDLTFTNPTGAPTALTGTATGISGGGFSTASATLNGSVNPNGPATSVYFQYGLTTNYDIVTTTNVLASTNGFLAVSRVINTLQGAIVYHFRIVASNNVGTNAGGDQTFATPVLTPYATSFSVTAITTNGATLNAMVDPNGTATSVNFLYGQTASYGFSTATNNLPATNVFYPITMTITNLLPGTVHHYILSAVYTSGSSSFSDRTFTTASAGPAATVQNPSGQTATSVTFKGTVFPSGLATTWYFRYGPTTNYGNVTTTNSVGSTTSGGVGVSSLVSVPATGGLYHYQLIVSNNLGTAVSGDMAFTLPSAPAVSTQPATSIAGTSATLNATANPSNALTTLYFQYGTSTNYGSNTPSQPVPNLALNFNGSNQSATLIAPLQGLATGSSPHTIEAWVKPTLLPASREWLLLLGDNIVGAHHWLINQDGSTDIGSLGLYSVHPTLNPNVWTHIAVSSDGNIFRLYINGSQFIAYSSFTFDLEGISLRLADAQNGESFYGGAIDEVRIWNTTRSAAEIQNNRNTTLLGTEAGLVAYYRMDETSGNLVNDLSGHGNTLQTTNNPTWTAGASIPGVVDGQLVPGLFSVTNLNAATVYHFRAVASNGVAAVYGNDLTFTTPSSFPSVVMQGATGISTTGATINGQINSAGADTTYWFQYGLTTNYGSFSPVNLIAATNVFLPVSRALTELAPGGVAYHYCLVASNSFGLVTGSDTNFLTAVTAPTAATLPFTPASTTSAILNGQVNPDGATTTYYFQYGATASYGSFSPTNSLTATNYNFAVNSTVSGLTFGQTYHYQLVASNSAGMVFGGDQIYSGAGSPIVTTLPGTPSTMTDVRLTGLVQPNGGSVQASFEWGPGTMFLQETAGTNISSGFSTVGFSNQLNGLTPGVAYHYRAKASNALGVVRGGAKWFSAPAINILGNNPVIITTNTFYTDAGATITISPQAIGSGQYFNLVARADGTVAAWGRGEFGNLNVPTSATNVMAVTGGLMHSVALRTDGTVIAWGNDSNGGQTDVPNSATNVIAISSGWYHNLALRADHTLVPWGLTLDFSIPTLPNGLTNVIAMGSGGFHNLAVRADGKVVAWGHNDHGQTNVPANATNVVLVSAGNNSSLALRTDRTLIAWGDNAQGENNIPAQATNVVAIASGLEHHLALRADGTLVAWGHDQYGQTDIPANATNIVAISAGGDDSTALRVDGTLICWGYGAFGENIVPTDLNDPHLILGTTSTVNTNAGGVYQVNYSTTNTAGIVSTATRTVLVTPGSPAVTTLPATAVGNDTATLNGSINQNGAASSWYFQYGTTTAYGQITSSQLIPSPSVGLSFNGVNQSAALFAGTMNGLDTGNVPHTIEAWLNPTLLPPSREWVVLLGDFTGGAHHWLLNPDGTTQIGSLGGSQVNPTLSPNVWTHVAAVFDGTNFSVYTNGVLVGTTAATFNLTGISLSIADSHLESTYGGAMDEVRIWNTARTQSQIQNNMHTPLIGNEAGLIAYYSMNSFTSDIYLSDYSGHNNDLQTANNPSLTTGADIIDYSTNQTYLNLTQISRGIGGLIPGTLYHFRLVATNSSGIAYGNDLTFITTGTPPATTPFLTSPTILGNGSFQFSFTNSPGASFSVLASTNVGAPLTNWVVLTNVVESPAGQFHFTIPQAGFNQRFFRVQSP